MVREVSSYTVLNEEELAQLFSIFRSQYLLCCSWGLVSPTDPTDKQDPNCHACDTYRVDIDRFALMLGALTEWTWGGEKTEKGGGGGGGYSKSADKESVRHPPVVRRLFRLLDDDGEGAVVNNLLLLLLLVLSLLLGGIGYYDLIDYD